jgi:WD40 repeat protein
MISLLLLKQRDIALSNEAMAKATSSVSISNVATAEVKVKEAERQATIARAEELAAQSLYAQDKDLPASFLLGVEAYKTFDTPLTRNALLQGAEYEPQLLCFLDDHATSSSIIGFSPDSKMLAIEGCEKTNELEGCTQSTVKLLNVANGQPIGQITTSPASIAFSPDGKTLAFGNSDGSVTLRVVATLQMIGQPLRTSDTGGISNLIFCPDGKILASGSGVGSNGDGGPINLWNVASQKLIWSLPGIRFGPYSLAFSSDGKTLFYLG